MPFPIGIVFGDRDQFGSTGSDTVVKSSKFFESGESQLFVLENADHNTYIDNPEGLVSIIDGFFTGTIRHVFQEKDRDTFAPPKSAEK